MCTVGVTYQWVDGVVKDVHSVRPMTDAERAVRDVEVDTAQAEALEAAKAARITDFPTESETVN